MREPANPNRGRPLPAGANAILHAQRLNASSPYGLADGICLRHQPEPLTGSQVPWTLPMGLDFAEGAARRSSPLDFTDELGLYR
jgi:hypothetical protein